MKYPSIYTASETVKEIKEDGSIITAVIGEDCILESITFKGSEVIATITNSQKNQLLIPLIIFEKYFVKKQ